MRVINIYYKLRLEDESRTNRYQFDLSETEGRIFIDEFQSYIDYHIEKIGNQIRINLKQTDMNILYYSLEVIIEAAGNVFSFNNLDCKEQIIQDEFLGIGFNQDNKGLYIHPGLGMDNQFEQITRIRKPNNRGGFTKKAILKDLELVSIDSNQIKIKYGEAFNFLDSRIDVTVDTSNQAIYLKQGYYRLDIKNKSDINVGYYLKSIEQDRCVELEYQSIDGNSSDVEYFQILVDGNYSLMIDGQCLEYTIDRVTPTVSYYNQMLRGKGVSKVIYINEGEKVCNLRDARLNSQLYLADNLDLGYSSYYQKLLHIAAICNVNNNYHIVPNKNYSPDMYARDAFWSVVAIEDQKLNEGVLSHFANSQNSDGCIATIITPSRGCIEKKGNEATMEFLWWNYLNYKRGYKLSDKSSIDLAVKYIFNTFDPQLSGKCTSEYILGQNDIVDFIGSPRDDISVNQGMYAVTLKVIKELGYQVDQNLIDVAIEEYKLYYDQEQKRLLNNREIKTTFSYGDLLPAFVFYWLFDIKIFSKLEITNILNSFKEEQGIGLFIGDYATKYIRPENNPFNQGFSYKDGEYYNGGSWMREECCAYGLGIAYGISEYEQRLNNRIKAEFNFFPDEPYSHEHLNLNPEVFNSNSSTVLFAWNSFVLEVLKIKERKK